ncbi:serine/threonine-protein kinase [Nocardia mangyaensis]|uniref:serine/threonine-protein kinase n=1 Tax=Nocardia mangyaensis TaxID=2213200 RepID=UPI0026773931|nr:serine/threonine-protein kinase [Nocardia mangyaensis]MDO3648052.1 protein kinase [Nocardia mangyaensis]
MKFGAGTVFAGYRIERMLGRGGMGTVYLAAHPRLPRQVALKLLNRELYSDDEVRGRFEREADVSAHLDHPGVVTVLDRGVENGLMWISMQYVDGTDASVFRGAPMDPARAVNIIAQTAEALDYAHERGVLHRDIKPANILLAPARDGDRVVLTDFGIARLRGDSRELTRTGAFLATLAYAAPEQLSGETVDHRCDQYSLGCTLFTLLTGESPFPADNPGAVVAAHLTKPVPRASVDVPDLPPAIDAVLARVMAKDRAERFSSCTEFAYAAAAALSVPGFDHLVLSADPASPPRLASADPGAPTPTLIGPPIEVVPADDAHAATSVTVAGGTDPRLGGFTPASTPSATSAPHLMARPHIAGSPHAAAPQPAASQHAASVPLPHAVASPDVAGPSHAAAPHLAASPHFVSAPHLVGPPHNAVSARWRVLAVSLLVLAGIGFVGAGAVYWKFVRPPAPTWGAHESVAAGFTDLIPAGPSGRGWRDAACFATPALVVLPGDPVPIRQITCNDATGIQLWYTEFRTPADAGAYLARHTTEDTTRQLLGSSLTAYRPRDPAAPFTLAARQFGDVRNENSVVEVSWPDHTFEQTRDDWWQQAPF